MANGGMVAVVQGLQDANLTVTLLDRGKQYTLMPNDHVHEPIPAPVRYHPSVDCASQCVLNECSASPRSCENGTQATDGRYASTYKMMHCNVRPTSPPERVAEFPPQRPEILHGHGNFVIGGSGSGETTRPVVRNNSYRGGMVWPDKGSVCESRASVQSDAFASSLRKYPNITPERSNEIVQRLISFTQAKNSSKLQNMAPCPPPRNSEVSGSSNTFILERNSSKNLNKMTYRTEVNTSSIKNKLSEKPPVRDRSNNVLQEHCDSQNRPMFYKTNDVRCFKDTARKVKQGFKTLAEHPTSHLSRDASSAGIREQYHNNVYQRRVYEQESNNSVNMEIQATAQMESKEILTLPRIAPKQRTIATPLSPIPSRIDRKEEEGLMATLSSSTELIDQYSCKSTEIKLPLDARVKVTSSSFDLRKVERGKYNKRIRSQEELGNIKKNNVDGILRLPQGFYNYAHFNDILNKVKGPKSTKRRICQNCKHLIDFDILRRSVSDDNTCFHEDDQFNSNRQKTSKHFIGISRNRYYNRTDRVKKDKDNKYMIQKPENVAKCMSHIDTGNNKSVADAYAQDLNRSTVPSYESRSIQYDSNMIDPMNIFVNRKRCHRQGISNSSRCGRGHSEDLVDEGNENDIFLTISQQQIRNLIELDMLAFTEKYRVNISTERLYDLIEELVNLFETELNETSISKKLMTEKIKNILLKQRLSEFRSIYLANILVEHWEEQFIKTNNLKLIPSNYKSERLIVLPNITQSSLQYKPEGNNTANDHDFSINEISQKDIDNQVKVYVDQISHEINEWLSNFQIPEVQYREIRQAVINDLATDIVDRHKYLQLNTSSEISEISELEHLRYQIFKLIFKLGISDMTVVDRAVDLMRRINDIAVPIFSIKEKQARNFHSTLKDESVGQNERLNVVETSNLGASSSQPVSSGCCNKPTYKKDDNQKISEFSANKNISLKEPARSTQTTNNRRMTSPAIFGFRNTEDHTIEANRKANPCGGGIAIKDEVNDNKNDSKNAQINQKNISYTEYLRDWVEKLPLPMTNAEDEMAVKVAKTDIYNGILEAVSKLKSERDTLKDRFLFEDKLDDEIEKLISKLPQSQELISKKNILKSNLIEKTCDSNMKSTTGSYRQQLVENLKSNVPKPTLNEVSLFENPDLLEIFEELQILNLVEAFILSSHYENQDPVAAETYRNKLVKDAKTFVDELKANHNKALKDIDTQLYLKDILAMLVNIPLPSNETIQEAADEILIAVEIEKWSSDLPLIENNEFGEQLCRRRLRNKLAKQILDKEKGIRNTVGVMDDNSLKHDISQFLEKAPLKQGESININAMVDKLISRLKNRPRSIGNDSKKVSFNDLDYDEFIRNMPLCSTYTGDQCENTQCETRRIPNIKPIQGTDPRHQLHSVNISPSNENDPNRMEQSHKSTQAIEPIDQSHSRHYHSIAQPLFDDVGLNFDCCNEELRDDGGTHNRVPPGTSTSNRGLDRNWYTLGDDNTHEHLQSNKSISPREASRNEPVPVNTSRRLIENDRFNRIEPTPKHDISVPQRYPENEVTNDYGVQQGHEVSCKRTNSPRRVNENNAIVPSGSSNIRRPNCCSPSVQDQERRDSPRITQKSPRLNQTGCPHRTPHRTSPKEPSIHSNRLLGFENLIEEQLVGSPEINRSNLSYRSTGQDSMPQNIERNKSPTPRRQNAPRICQRSPRLNQVFSPHRTPHHPTTPQEPNSSANRSRGFDSIIEERRGRVCSPETNQSDYLYRSTERDGVTQNVESNRSMEAVLDNYNNPEHQSGYYKPTMLIPPGYVPMIMGTTKGGHMPERNIDDTFREEVSEDETVEEDEMRCRCVENVWRSKRRYRYCPFGQYDGFPMCMTPYFYPYFY